MQIELNLRTLDTASETVSIYNGDFLLTLKTVDLKNSLNEGVDSLYLPIGNLVKDLGTLKVSGFSDHPVEFTEAQQTAQKEISDSYVELPRMTEAELRTYPFDPTKHYRVHITKELMNLAPDRTPEDIDFDPSVLSYLLGPDTNNVITDIIIDEDVDYIGHCAFTDCSNLQLIKIPRTVNFISTDSWTRDYQLVIIMDCTRDEFLTNPNIHFRTNNTYVFRDGLKRAEIPM